jgi:hypothetical protein
VQDNCRYNTYYHDESRTFNTRNETTVFNDHVNGYIRHANTTGAINAFKQETHTPDPTVPRSLKASKQNGTPSHIPSIKHNHPLTSAHHTTCNRVTPSQNRDVAAGRGKELGYLTLTGGEKSSSQAARSELPRIDTGLKVEFSKLSPEMQEFVTGLQDNHSRRMAVQAVKKGRKGRGSQKSSGRKPVPAQRHREVSQQRPGDSSNDEAFAEDQPNHYYDR